MSPIIHELLRQLETELRNAGDHDSAMRIQEAIADSAVDLNNFLQSNELWGGSGSIADQAAIGNAREARRKVEEVLIRLGEEQMLLGVVNQRTALWVHAFSEWKRQGI